MKPRSSHSMWLKRSGKATSQDMEGSAEIWTPEMGDMSADFIFHLKVFLKDKYGKMTVLNLSSSCGFKVTQTKPFLPRVAVSDASPAWDHGGGTGLRCPEWWLFPSMCLNGCHWNNLPNVRRHKPLPGLPGFCVPYRICLHDCFSIAEDLSWLSTSTRNRNQRFDN